MRPTVETLLEQGQLRLIDVQAGKYIGRHTNSPDQKLLEVVSALTSQAIAAGHVCLPLATLVHELHSLECTDISTSKLQQILLDSEVVTRPGKVAPLVLDQGNRLYLYRFYQFEQTIAHGLLTRIQDPALQDNQEETEKTLDQLFPQNNGGNTPDLQRQAAAAGRASRLLVVSGGPGTGKTYTAARILAAIGQSSSVPLRTCLAAPTGKAAARLKESISLAREELPVQFQPYIPDETSTIHRLLRVIPASGRFRHNRTNPLHLDLLMVDEASMIDVPLMASLMEALPSHCRLILLGDRNQLASVEAGNLFADICSLDLQVPSPALSSPMHQAPVIQLQQSYRFAQTSGIGRLATAILSGDQQEVKSCLKNPGKEFSFSSQSPGKGSYAALEQFTEKNFAPIFASTTPAEALARFDQARVLCCTKRGEAGVLTCNQLVEQYLCKTGRIPNTDGPYHGMPILVLRNDYALNIFNGDTGITWQDAHGSLHAWFKGAEGNYTHVPLQQLPSYQTGYGMTVHKSQGSEYNHVLFVLPGQDTPLLCRELLYTGITRTKDHLTITGSQDLLLQGISRTAERFSGLAHALQQLLAVEKKQ